MAIIYWLFNRCSNCGKKVGKEYVEHLVTFNKFCNDKCIEEWFETKELKRR